MRKNFIIMAVAFAVGTAACSRGGHSPEGHYRGEIALPEDQKLELVLHIEKADNGLAASIDLPAMGVNGLPADEVVAENGELRLSCKALQMDFSGKLAPQAIEGNVTFNGQEYPLTLSRFEKQLPGNPKLVSSDKELAAMAAIDPESKYKYKVADYFARPKSSAFQLSPDGKYMSYREKDDAGKRHVYVKNIATGESIRVIEEKDELVRSYGWINNERLVYLMDQGGNENYHLFAVNIDGSEQRDLTPFDGVRAQIESMLREQKDYIIVNMNRNNPQVFEPYKLNVVTGDLEQLFENTNMEEPAMGYSFDRNGQLRAYYTLRGTISNMYYKDLATGKFNKIAEVDQAKCETFGIYSFNYASKNPDEAYVFTNLDSDKARLVLYDLNKNRVIREVYSHADYDVSGMRISKKRSYEVDYYAYEGERYQIEPVSNTYKRIHQLMEKEFSGKDFYIADYDDDENTLLISVSSDRFYGAYYEFDAKTEQFKLLYELMPQLREEDMAEMRPITFKSRDGITLHGYITLPKAAIDGQKVPLVVNPHGGPQGLRDSWGFNPETQLFASRGYATLQVNFRISGGYGKEFQRIGYKQIGRKVMDDVEDGVRYVIEQGWVDASKIAIYGASHGGYATLMGLVKTPDLYCCGIDYVGVSNIFTFMNTMPEYWKPYLEMVKTIWYDLDVPEEEVIAREVSPVYHIDKISKPLFVVQGANDPRVNIDESDQIVEALRAKGFSVPYMVKYNEGHGFQHEENKLELYRCMLGFLAQQFGKK